MKRLRAIIGRWRAQRIRTKRGNDLFRTYDENQATLEGGGTL